MAKKDIFDLNEVEDLPDFCKKQLKLINIHIHTQRLLELFALKSELTVDEIVVGMYRKYGLEKTRVWVSSTLYNLKRRDLIKKIDKEKYARVY
jgi:hypothetical protein